MLRIKKSGVKKGDATSFGLVWVLMTVSEVFQNLKLAGVGYFGDPEIEVVSKTELRIDVGAVPTMFRASVTHQLGLGLGEDGSVEVVEEPSTNGLPPRAVVVVKVRDEE